MCGGGGRDDGYEWRSVLVPCLEASSLSPRSVWGTLGTKERAINKVM